MEIEYGKEPKRPEEMEYFLTEGRHVHKKEVEEAMAEKVQQLLADKVKCAERLYREKAGQKDTDPEVLKDLLYQLAKAIRNVSGKEPSSVGLEVGRLLCKLRCLDGERYDREVLLYVKKEVEVECTAEGALEAAKHIVMGSTIK